MRIYLMTDLEGAACVMNFEDWCEPRSRYYEMAREFLTLEVNAAVEGFFAGGATEVVVADGHGCGAVSPLLLDARAELERGWPEGWVFKTRGQYDAVAWVGQHAKAGSELAHLAHTEWFDHLDMSVNGVSIGEFGELALSASEFGVPAIFGTGDLAFTREAQALLPGIETVAVKRGTTPGHGDECTTAEYARRNTSAIHLQPVEARRRIRAGAERAVRRITRERFGLLELTAPFERVVRFRPDGELPARISRQSHPTSVSALISMKYDPKPV